MWSTLGKIHQNRWFSLKNLQDFFLTLKGEKKLRKKKHWEGKRPWENLWIKHVKWKNGSMQHNYWHCLCKNYAHPVSKEQGMTQCLWHSKTLQSKIKVYLGEVDRRLQRPQGCRAGRSSSNRHCTGASTFWLHKLVLSTSWCPPPPMSKHATSPWEMRVLPWEVARPPSEQLYSSPLGPADSSSPSLQLPPDGRAQVPMLLSYWALMLSSPEMPDFPILHFLILLFPLILQCPLVCLYARPHHWPPSDPPGHSSAITPHLVSTGKYTHEGKVISNTSVDSGSSDL